MIQESSNSSVHNFSDQGGAQRQRQSGRRSRDWRADARNKLRLQAKDHPAPLLLDFEIATISNLKFGLTNLASYFQRGHPVAVADQRVCLPEHLLPNLWRQGQRRGGRHLVRRVPPADARNEPWHRTLPEEYILNKVYLRLDTKLSFPMMFN